MANFTTLAVEWGAFLAVMLFASSLAYDIRLYAIREYGTVIHEFDPWFNYRATEYLDEHGWHAFFHWFDYESWYPLGRPVGARHQVEPHGALRVAHGQQATVGRIRDGVGRDGSRRRAAGGGAPRVRRCEERVRLGRRSLEEHGEGRRQQHDVAAVEHGHRAHGGLPGEERPVRVRRRELRERRQRADLKC